MLYGGTVLHKQSLPVYSPLPVGFVIDRCTALRALQLCSRLCRLCMRSRMERSRVCTRRWSRMFSHVVRSSLTRGSRLSGCDLLLRVFCRLQVRGGAKRFCLYVTLRRAFCIHAMMLCRAPVQEGVFGLDRDFSSSQIKTVGELGTRQFSSEPYSFLHETVKFLFHSLFMTCRRQVGRSRLFGTVWFGLL